MGPRDLLLIRQAIREGWDTPPAVAAAIIRQVVTSALQAKKPRLTIAAARVCIDAMKAEQAADAMQRRQGRALPPNESG